MVYDAGGILAKTEICKKKKGQKSLAIPRVARCIFWKLLNNRSIPTYPQQAKLSQSKYSNFECLAEANIVFSKFGFLYMTFWVVR